MLRLMEVVGGVGSVVVVVGRGGGLGWVGL
jgi:hypothetical protein